MNELTGTVMDIDHFAVHDGPGIRTCVYMKGCSISCRWCHSPESQSPHPEILFAASRCTLCGACTSVCPHQKIQNGIRSFSRGACLACGRCVVECPSLALSLVGRSVTVDAVVAESMLDEVFFRSSGGGVTFTGGEVLMQAAFLRAVMVGLKNHGIHIILETSGYGSRGDLLSFVPLTDIFYFDYKLGNHAAFLANTSGNLTVVQGNLAALRKQTSSIVLRIPLIPNLTDTKENVAQGFRLARELDLHTVHLLRYNASAAAKYDWIGKKYTLGNLVPRANLLDELLALVPAGVHVEVF